MRIYTVGNEADREILTTKSKPVESFTPELKSFINEMIETLGDTGIGLAAPQVGRNERFFITKIGDDDPVVFINPEIIETSEALNVYEEGCLSVPDSWAKVKRPERIKVQAWNIKGRPFTIETGGVQATCIQHEYDHLDGILFYDRVSERKRAKIEKKCFGS